MQSRTDLSVVLTPIAGSRPQFPDWLPCHALSAADRALAATGSSLSQEMAEARRHAIKELYFSKNLLPRIVVTRQMQLDAYEKDPKRWEQAATVELYTTRWALSTK